MPLKNQIMAENNSTEPIVDIQQTFSKADSFFENNKKPLLTLLLAVLVFVGGYVAYTYYLTGQNQEASELIWKAEYYFEVDSLDKAINGDGNYAGFQTIADNYSGTKTGELAEYYLGVAYLNKGEFQKAIDHLEKCSLDDQIVGAIAKGATGDAYVELGNLEKGLSNFDAAISHSDNNFTAPIYLMKKANVLEKQNNWKGALDAYNIIKQKYSNTTEGREIEKYIARAESFVK